VGTRSTLALTAFLFVAGCTATEARDEERVGSASARIQGGFVDGRDDGVVGVALIDEEGRIRRTCSGTLIAPNLVLTAQHCVADTKESVVCRTSVFGSLFPAERLRVTSSDSMWADDTDWERVTEVIAPPGPPKVCGRDVALVVLQKPLACAATIAPRLDGPPIADEVYAAIGYGATRGGAHDAGIRRRRNAMRVRCVGEACLTPQVARGEWRGDRGICNGDSGGPALDASGRVIGVTSRGPAGCEDPIYGGLAAHAEWIREGAARAAIDGEYELPGWASGADTDSPECTAPTVIASGGSCAVASARNGGGAGWLALTALTLVLILRRRAGDGSRMTRATSCPPGSRPSHM
jgi:hypothetical protein